MMYKQIIFIFLLFFQTLANSSELVSFYVTRGEADKYDFKYKLHVSIGGEYLSAWKKLPEGKSEVNLFCAKKENGVVMVSHCGKLGKVDNSQVVLMDYSGNYKNIPYDFSGNENSILVYASKKIPFEGKKKLREFAVLHKPFLAFAPETSGFIN